ncbi:MAG: glycosyltransferase, partial [Dysgonamonadaceae bacterium]
MVNLKTKPNPLITVVTVCYNSADLIEETLKSVTEQNYSNKEYVVIDGASTDGTDQIIDKFIDLI